MSLSKEDVLKTLEEQGINNLEDLTSAAVEAKLNSKGAEMAVFVHHSYVFTS